VKELYDNIVATDRELLGFEKGEKLFGAKLNNMNEASLPARLAGRATMVGYKSFAGFQKSKLRLIIVNIP